MNDELIDQAHECFAKYGDGDMTREEVVLLLTMNDFSEDVANHVASDIFPE